MSEKKKFILVSLSIIWLILIIVWGISKSSIYSGKAPKNKKSLPSLTTIQKKVEKEKTERLETPVLVKTFRVKKVDYNDVLPVMGEIKPKAEIPLKFEINGRITNIFFKEGDFIKKGDLIATLSPKDSELKLNYTKSKFRSAEANHKSLIKKLEIYQELFDAKAIIENKLREIELEVESAKAQMQAVEAEKMLAEEELKKTNFYAITDGIMGSKEAEKGQFVTSQDKIASLLDISQVFVEIGLVERDISKVKLGQKAHIFVDSYPNKVFEGIVKNIFPLIEGKSRTLTVKLKVLDPKGLLKPGMFSRAEILALELKNALIVPSVSLINTGKDIFLLPVIPKASLEEEEEGTFLGRISLRTIKLGYLSSDYAHIVDGLEENDLVVIETQGELNDGIKVRVIGIDEFGY